MMHCILVSCFAELGSWGIWSITVFSCFSLFQSLPSGGDCQCYLYFSLHDRWKTLPFWTTASWLQVRCWQIFVRNGFPLDEIRKVRRSMLMSLLLPDAMAALDPRQQVTAAMQKAICLRRHGDFFDFSKTLLAFHKFGRTAFENRFLKPVGRIDRPRDLQKGGIWRRW